MKKPIRFFRKMQRQEINLDDVHDLIAFRVLVDSIEQCYEVLGAIHSLWRPIQGRFKDYIAMPKGNSYQSLHTTVVCFDGERVEFQIRTFAMHEIAEKGIAAHWKYKEDGRLDTKDEEKFRWLRQLVDWQTELQDSLEFVDTFKMDLFEDEIFVFTPNGDLKTLCHHATPVDFAYAVHSDVGHRCAGARVNGRMVPLSQKLESGDTVEIITKSTQTPNKDWLDFVQSSKAKTHIRQYIRREQKEKSRVIGQNIFESASQKSKLKPAKVLKSEELQAYLKSKKTNLEEFFTNIAYGKIDAREVIEELFHPDPVEEESPERDENVIKKIFKKIGSRNKNLILVDKQDGILVTFGKCCNPVKGDAIIGFVTRGRGVAIHRTDCPRVFSIDPDRRMDVAWNDDTEQESLARIFVIAEDRKGMLAEITKTISERDVNIIKVWVKAQSDGVARISLDLSVKNIHELRSVVKSLEGIKHVLNVVRE
ncbi:MAG: bifunctional (p)ppGpp synthetase/guanosine-3',5'-bis(diphosphate) 3'-pyrophosphohydrolase [Deltaproteobacteria bacterium]|nr:bifunctional (p)ppGpp synthetase/guanosine-3',5'-bis(diphosphate) 3'-pyrophosphohydrolase [Deltaproteobacteria bacterium]